MPSYLLRSTHSVLTTVLRDQEKKLREKLPHSLHQGYQTGGYWHDNALFEAAQMDQAVLVFQMAALSELLRQPVFIEDLEVDGETVSIGTEIVIARINGSGEEEQTYRVLGPADARLLEDVLPYTAPLFQAIKGRKTGDCVTVDLPGGKTEIKIISIRPLFLKNTSS